MTLSSSFVFAAFVIAGGSLVLPTVAAAGVDPHHPFRSRRNLVSPRFPPIRVHPATGGFIELQPASPLMTRRSAVAAAAHRTYHGVNYVRKGTPYIADVNDACVADACPPPSEWLITDADALRLQQRGMNVVRLGLMWNGAMPTAPSTFNATYFEQVERAVNVLAKRGVSTILDLHQDVLSPRICGEGAPLWVNTSHAALGGLPFPEPLGLKPVGLLPNGLPNCSAAFKPIGWSSFYMTDVCGKAFEAIYADSPPQMLGSQIAQFWAETARRFKDNPAVLAYELLNEPWIGDAIEHPGFLLSPGKADLAQLAPFYAQIHEAIRAHDNETIILYSGVEIGDRLTSPVGFEVGPGGHEYDDRQALVLHNYCVLGTDGHGPQPGIGRLLCNVTDGRTFTQRAKDATKLKTALFMTEFGAVDTSSTGLREIREVADGADKLDPPLSWAYWAWDQFKGRGASGAEDLRWSEIMRSYAPRVEGTSPRWSGGAGDRFELTFTTTASSSSGEKEGEGEKAGEGTVVFFAPGLMNATLSVTPAGTFANITGWPCGAAGEACEAARYVHLRGAMKSGVAVTVVIEKKRRR